MSLVMTFPWLLVSGSFLDFSLLLIDSYDHIHRGASLMTISQEQFETITVLARSYGATRLYLFGSALDNPADAHDIDLACDGVAGWKLYELAARLEDELNVPFDLVPLTPPNRFTSMVEARGRRLL
jgi:predicted nucleotidyltransferase